MHVDERMALRMAGCTLSEGVGDVKKLRGRLLHTAFFSLCKL